MIFPLNPSYSGSVVSSGAIADLTIGQQFDIVEGTLVTTTDGKRWQYSAGDKLLEASYILISDETPDWAIIENKPSTFTPSAHTHGNLSDTGAIGTTPDLPLKTGTSGVIEAGSFGTTAGTFVEGDDSRLTGPRDPNPHASTHATGSTDPLTPADIGAATATHSHTEATISLPGFLSAADKTKLDGIDPGAEVNVQPDWNATSGDASIANKPTLGTSAALDTGTTAGTVATGDHTHADLHTRSHTLTSTSDHTAGTHKVFYSDSSGHVQELALGAENTVLTSSGTTSAPTFTAPTGGVTAIGSTAADVLSISGSDLTADSPAADRILFWDQSESKLSHLTPGTGLEIDGTDLNNTAPLTGTGSTDNAIIRADGTGGATLQNSDIVIDDATTSTQANVALVNNHSETNSAIVLTPKGTGAFIVGPKPDGTTTGGNARGVRAVDFSFHRTSAANVASGSGGFVGAGFNGRSGQYSAAIACYDTQATGQYAFAAQRNAVASGQYGTAIGNNNEAQATGSAAVGGFQNIASGIQSGNFGGRQNHSTNSYAGTLVGYYGLADRYAMQAHASGQFAARGDAQRARFVLRNKTTNDTATELFLDGSSTRLTIPSGKTIGGTIQLAGASSGGEEAVHYIRQFLIRNRGGTTSLIGSVQTVGTDIEATGLTGCDVTLTADDTNDALKVEVQGPAPITGATIEADDDKITATAHGLANDTDIVFTSLTGGAGLTASTTTYWVINATTDDFQVSTTRGGSAVDITTDYTDATIARVIRWVANVDATEIGFGL